MAYTRDWSESTPIDHTKFKDIPSAVRNLKVDISDRLKNFFYGLTAGETTEGAKKLEFYVQGTAPSSASNKIVVYGESDGTNVGLKAKDDNANEAFIFAGGGLALFGTTGSWLSGDVLLSFSTETTRSGWTDVTSTYDGKFFRFGTGTTKATSGSDTHDHGGATADHTLTESEMPAHIHSHTIKGGGDGYAGAYRTDGFDKGSWSTGSTGGGDPHSHNISSADNIPAYVQGRIWEKD